LKVVRSDARLPVGVPIDGVAFTASSVTLPSLSCSLTEVVGIFFIKIFLAAGEGVPEAYVAAGAVAAESELVQLPLGASATGR
jgi:hypothetical protein